MDRVSPVGDCPPMAYRFPPVATSRRRHRGVRIGATDAHVFVRGLKATTEAVMSSFSGLTGVNPPATYNRPPNAAAAAAPRGAGSLVLDDHEPESGSKRSTVSSVASSLNPPAT